MIRGQGNASADSHNRSRIQEVNIELNVIFSLGINGIFCPSVCYEANVIFCTIVVFFVFSVDQNIAVFLVLNIGMLDGAILVYNKDATR